MLRTSIAPKTAAQRERLLDALTQLADTDPLLRCEVDSITHEFLVERIFFLGVSGGEKQNRKPLEGTPHPSGPPTFLASFGLPIFFLGRAVGGCFRFAVGKIQA